MGIAPSSGRKDRRRVEPTLSSRTIEQPIPIGRDGDPMLIEACTITAVF
jgi:hypothetical protein